jgi:hypothetical protein
MIAGKICSRCRGTGKFKGKPCPDCLGAGRLPLNINAIVAVTVGIATRKHSRLRADLDGAWTFYQQGLRMRDQPAIQRKDRQKTIALAEKLKSRLEADFWFGPHALADARRLVQRLKARKESARLWRVLGIEKGSALDNLVAKWLPAIFENYFKGKGSYIDFAAAVLAEYGISVERRAISDAYTRGRHGRKKITPKPEKK